MMIQIRVEKETATDDEEFLHQVYDVASPDQRFPTFPKSYFLHLQGFR
jgi:hypothetical protein